MFFSPLSSFIPLSLTSTLSLRLPLLVSLDVQWWPVCGGSPYGKVTVVVFFLQSHCVVRLYLGFEEIGFEFMRFVGYEKIECLIWEWDRWRQCGFGSVFNGNGMGLGQWFWGGL